MHVWFDGNGKIGKVKPQLSAGRVQSVAVRLIVEREREIIVLFFGLSTNHPLSLEEIGEKFNLTRERVRQIKDKALQRLRHTSRSKILKSYLG